MVRSVALTPAGKTSHRRRCRRNSAGTISAAAARFRSPFACCLASGAGFALNSTMQQLQQQIQARV